MGTPLASFSPKYLKQTKGDQPMGDEFQKHPYRIRGSGFQAARTLSAPPESPRLPWFVRVRARARAGARVGARVGVCVCACVQTCWEQNNMCRTFNCKDLQRTKLVLAGPKLSTRVSSRTGMFRKQHRSYRLNESRGTRFVPAVATKTNYSQASRERKNNTCGHSWE